MVESTMSKLQALATLVGMSNEFDLEIEKLEQIKLNISMVLSIRRQQLDSRIRSDPVVYTSKDPDAAIADRYIKSLQELKLLEDSIETLKEFTEGALKYA